ncbi:MAG: flagellar basal body P-ring protein FlgI [Phycisphaerae bacterium]|nr:flagellar basal body P-ring protein FlgI [Phycisphaerae bacterium]
MKKLLLIVLCALPIIISGCKTNKKEEFWGPSTPQWKPDSQVRDLCTITNNKAVRVWGYGLIIGLPETGSNDAPSSSVKEHIRKQLQVFGKSRLPQEYQNMSVVQMIASNKTAIVEVSGIVPAAAPKGTGFDIDVEINWASRTRSLQGGFLLPCDLTVVTSGHRGNLVRGVVGAIASGPIYINSFVEKKPAVNGLALHQGAILNGGKSIIDRKLTLKTEYSDFRLISLLERRINERFQKGTEPKVVYNTKDASIIELDVPREYRDKFVHFIQVLSAMYLPDNVAFQTKKLKEIDAQIVRGNLTMQQWAEISLIWESIGRQALPHMQKYYQSTDNYAQFHAVRTALNLQDDLAVNRMVDIAMSDSHKCQMPAIRFLAYKIGDSRVYTRLEKLLAHSNPEIQLEVYSTLSASPGLAIRNYQMPSGFRMDIIESSSKGLIYIWAHREPRIVIFGKNLLCRKNIFFESNDKSITINSTETDNDIKVIKTSPLTFKSISAHSSTFLVKDLIDALSCSPQAANPGLGLNFSEIASIIKELSEQGIIPADVKIYTGQK